ncbi:translocation/assembly module TamB [Novosphingobium sp. FSY-8]|uniref:Translocation/assembly module TamB n=1 Tax=Novosphingobium ovatum TaxID=1908523 RepID=A0ABW9XE59_9SPHN|nr:translocation/assembly module TamB domain-containing protein [Novosphingobium ovatum]NBC36821.1 translocation/assembly module TamB [Novosphingobium ovatum]
MPAEADTQVETPVKPPRPWFSGWRKYGVVLPLMVLSALVMALAGLDTPIGHRLIADVLRSNRLDNGLGIEVGRIEGSIYGAARLQGVALRDPHGVFLRAGEMTLDWRPLEWFYGLLDVRELALRRGTLLRAPQLRDTGRPLTWPDVDIRIDRLTVERLVVARGLAGQERRVDLTGRARLNPAEARLDILGRLGGGDRLAVHLDAARATDHFRLGVDYAAPKGGLLAALSHATQDRVLVANGAGTWARWSSRIVATQGAQPALDLRLSRVDAQVGVRGTLHTAPLFSTQRAAQLGARLEVLASGTWDKGRVNGQARLGSDRMDMQASGGVDLTEARFNALSLRLTAHQPLRASATDTLYGLRAQARLDGDYAAPRVIYAAQADRWASDDTAMLGLALKGEALVDKGLWRLPMTAQASAVVTGDIALDRQLHDLRATGTLIRRAGALRADDIRLTIPHAHAALRLRGDLLRGSYALAGDLQVRGWPLTVGPGDAQAGVQIRFDRGQPWRAQAQVRDGTISLANPTLANLAGDRLRLHGRLELGKNHHLVVSDAVLTAPRLTMNLTAMRQRNGDLAVDLRGRQATWGAFDAVLRFDDIAPYGVVRLANPLPAAGLRDVTLDLSGDDGAARRSDMEMAMRILARGQSKLGPFSGDLALMLARGGVADGRTAPPRVEVRRLALSNTVVSGAVSLGQDGASGRLAVSGGGVSGTLDLTPQAGGNGQGIDVRLEARNARFDAVRPITIGSGRLTMRGLIQKQHTTLSGDMQALGVGQGRLFIGRVAGKANLTDGRGRVSVAIGGRRGSRFDVQAIADVAPDGIAMLINGDVAGQPLSMPRRAMLTPVSAANGVADGWTLAPTQIDYAGGRVVTWGRVAGQETSLHLGLVDMPLSLANVVVSDLGLGGRASGVMTYDQPREGLPRSEARLLIRGMSRSGLTLSSRPVDVAVTGRLAQDTLEWRALASEAGQARGRMQARISAMPASGDLGERLRAGALVAQMRYAGPADALWRLMALEAFDLTGPVELAADMTGTLENPVIVGSLAGNNLRLQSAQSGTDITGITARGAFERGTLRLTRLEGRAANGSVNGSGRVDFSGMDGTRGPAIDITLAARNAQLFGRPDMAFTVSGPLRILSDGVAGTIAGRVTIDGARWRLGQAASSVGLPDVAVREVNRRADVAPASERQMPWRLLLDAAGGGIRIQGLGLDSQWRANVRLRGALLEPAITGYAELVDGAYEFAGKRFDVTRGRITFDGTSPPDPRLDMVASASINNITATVTVRGTSLRPEIAFSSVPVLPEEELLARILFGSSITQISAPEALQLGAALASLHGGGGLDPINKLRTVIGLDRLRIVDADATQNRQTGVAVGKYLGRRFYGEIVTDGRGYSATNLEFRLTSWLALLGSIASTGRQSVNAKIRHDY